MAIKQLAEELTVPFWNSSDPKPEGGPTFDEEKQCASSILMIRPAAFAFNCETADTNSFQTQPGKEDCPKDVAETAKKEFDQAIEVLKNAGIHVTVADDTAEPATPDAVFGNNWLTTFNDGSVVIFPMMAPSRRLERTKPALRTLIDKYHCKHLIDMTSLEEKGMFLEGTGSLVLDRKAKIAYASLSERTHEEAVAKFCEISGYKSHIFTTKLADDDFESIPSGSTSIGDSETTAGSPATEPSVAGGESASGDSPDETEVGKAPSGKAKSSTVYHTNVVMSVLENSVIAYEGIVSEEMRKNFEGKKLVLLKKDQVKSFCGNLLEVETSAGKRIVMSRTAYNALTPEQREDLQEGNESKFVVIDIPTIEKYGGGSARCMMTEIFLTPKDSQAGSPVRAARTTGERASDEPYSKAN